MGTGVRRVRGCDGVFVMTGGVLAGTATGFAVLTSAIICSNCLQISLRDWCCAPSSFSIALKRLPSSCMMSTGNGISVADV